MFILFFFISIINALTVTDILQNTNYIQSVVSDNHKYIYYVVEENKNGVKTNVLYQTSVSNNGNIFIELATGVSKDIYYSKTLDTIFYTKCDTICSLYSLDKTMTEYQVTKDVDVKYPQITKEHIFFITPIFFGMKAGDSFERAKMLKERGTTSHHVFKQTPLGKGENYFPTDDDGTPQYEHIVQAKITIDENGIITVGDYVDISTTCGDVVSFDIDENESTIVYEGKSTAPSKDKENYLKSSVYMFTIADNKNVCVSCEYKGHQMQPQTTKKGKFIVFLRTTNVLEKNPAKYLVLYSVERNQYIADKTLNAFQIEDFVLGKHSNEEQVTIFLRNHRREAKVVQRAIYSVKAASWSYEDLTVEGSIEFMAEVPCKDSTSCLVVAESFHYQPAELYYFDEALVATKLTTLNDYSKYNLEKPTFVTPMGGLNDRIQSMMFLPQNAEKAPVMLIVHDNEEGTSVDGFSKLLNPYVYTTEGYAVVMINSHVSLGYGDRMKLKGRNDFNVIVEDIKAVINELQNGKYPLDTTKIAVVGLYGASNIVPYILDAKLPVTVAAVHAPILSLKAHSYTDSYYSYEYLFEGAEWENPLWFQRNDAMKNAGSYSIPTLISYGDLDFVVDKSQPISLFQALQRRNVKSRLLRFPYSSNVLTKDEDIKVFYEQYLKWFNENLK